MVAVGGTPLPGWADREPRKTGLGEYLSDPGAVERGRGAGQRLGDLSGGVPGPAQLDDALPGGVFGRGLGRPRAGVKEKPGLAGPEIAYR